METVGKFIETIVKLIGAILALSAIGIIVLFIVIGLWPRSVDRSELHFTDADIEKLMQGGTISEARYLNYDEVCLFGRHSLERTRVRGCALSGFEKIGLVGEGACKTFSTANIPALVGVEYDALCRQPHLGFEIGIRNPQSGGRLTFVE